MKALLASNTELGQSIGFCFAASQDSALARLLRAFSPALVLCLLCSCATPSRPKTEPWVKDNHRIGTVTCAKTPWGYSCRYQDLSGRLVRLEKRDVGRNLCSGACITLYEHDSAGWLTAAQHFDASEKPCLTPAGYAICRWGYSQEADGGRVVEESYFDCEGKPVAAHCGCAVVRRTSSPDGKLKRVQLLNCSREPAAASWLGVANVAEVQYCYLQGIGEVTCAAFLDPSGTVVARKELAGETTGSWSDSVTTYNYPYNRYYHSYRHR